MFVKNWYNGISGQLNANASIPVVDINGAAKTAKGEYFRFKAVDEKSWQCSLFSVRTTYNTYGGVIFGTGTTPPTMDDYKLSGEIIKELIATASHAESCDNERHTVTTTYTLTNTSDEEITIGEIAAFTAAGNTTNFYMIERTVLDEPLTIPAGGIGMVTYTIKMNYPTA